MAGLDLTFDGDGRAITDLGGSDSINQLISAGNGKILAIGTSYAPPSASDSSGRYSSFIVRYNADGSLDNSFGTAGKLLTQVDYYSYSQPLVTPDGKIIIFNSGTENSVTRYNANGSLDTSFATAGKYTTSSYINNISLRTNPIDGSSETIVSSSSSSLLLDSTGKIKPFPVGDNPTASPLNLDSMVLSGIISSLTTNLSDPKVQAIVNLLGEPLINELRSTFNTPTVKYQNLSIFTAAQADGTILINFQGYSYSSSPSSSPVSSSQSLSVVSHFRSDGKFDPNYGVNGLLKFPSDSGSPLNVQIDRSDRFYTVFSNSIAKDIAVYRYTKDGKLDSSFGNSGKLVLPQLEYPSNSSYTNVAVVFDSQNRAIITSQNSNEQVISIVRVNNNGTVDTTFGTNGQLQLPVEGSIGSSRVLLGADDRLFFGSSTNNGDLLVSKYDISGTAAPIPPSISFSNSAFSVNENGVAIDKITLTRSGDPSQAIGVTVKLNNGGYNRATASADYNAADIQVTFAANEITKTIVIPIVNDNIAEGTETIQLSLTNPTGGATLGGQSTAILTILDDDFTGSDGNDTINGTAGDNIISGLGGDDFITPGTGKDTIDGGAGNDYLRIENSTNTANTKISYTTATNGAITGGSNDGTTFQNIEQVYFATGSGADNIDISATTGSSSGSSIYYSSNNISTGAGNDTIKGGSGNDDITPGTGKDTIDGGAGNDYLRIQNNTDTANTTISYTTATNGVITGGSNDGTTFQNIESVNITTGAGADKIDVSAAGVSITISAGAGDDTLIGSSKSGSNLSGGTGNDVITGGAGSDTINGGDGNDTLNGLGGRDTLTGGIGNDLFILGDASNNYYVGSSDDANIADFKPTEDKVQLQGSASDYRLQVSGGSTYLYLSKAANNTDDLIATFQNVTGLDLTSSSFKYVAFPSLVAFSSGTYSANEDGTAQVTLVRTGETVGESSINLILTDGTAKAFADYSNAVIPVTFAAGESSKVVTIPIIDNKIIEPNETINLSLANPSVGVGFDTQRTAIFTIIDNDVRLPGVLTFDRTEYSIKEDGTKVIAVTVNRTGGSDGAVSGTINLTNGTAKAGEDYNGSPITVNFADKETSKTVEIPIVNDTIYELSETVNLILANPTNGATLGNQQTASLTILDDDAVPGVLSLRSAVYSFNENDAPATTVVTIDRTGGSDGEVSANLLLSDGTAIGSDYTQNSITVTFANGETTKTVTIPIVNDRLIEPTETLNLALENPTSGASINPNKKTAVVSIVDDDTEINFSSGSYSVNEGDGTLQVTLVRTGRTVGQSSVTLGFSAQIATPKTDYDNTPISVIFEDGETTKTVTIPIVDDRQFELSETFKLQLENHSSGVNIGIKNTAVVNIMDNDIPGVLSFSNAAYTLNEDGLPSATVTINRTDGSDGEVSATLVLSDGTAIADTPIVGSDYNQNSISVTFADRETTKTISIPIINDRLLEATETFNLALENPVGGVSINPNKKTAVVSILDDDTEINFGSGSYSVNEGDSTLQVTLVRTGRTVGQSSVILDFSEQTATPKTDYDNTPISVVFEDGETTKTVTIPIVDDRQFELTETFKLRLENHSSGVNIGLQNTAVVNIVDNDTEINFSNSSYNVAEDGNAAQITLIRTGIITGQSSITLNFNDDTATALTDYDDAPISITFEPGETTKTVSVPIIDDKIAENSETVNLSLANLTGASGLGSRSTAQLTIVDNDLNLAPNLQVSSVIAPLTAFSGQETTVKWTIANVGGGATNVPSWTDKVYLSLDTTFDSTDIQLGAATNASYLNPGESYSNSASVILPRTLDATYYLLVEADGSKQLNEFNNEEDNFAASSPIKIDLTPPPDLQVTTVNAPTGAFSGQPINLNWTVENKGSRGTVGTLWSDSVFISTDEVFDAKDTNLGTFNHSGELNAGESYTNSAKVNLPVGVSGNYFFFVRTDTNNQIYENLFDSNNTNYDTTATNITLTPPPDLEFESVIFPANARAGGNLGINYRVTNFGASETTASSWRDTFYLSTDNKFDLATDLNIGSVEHYGILQPDGSYDNTANFTLDNKIAGSYYIFGVTDNENRVFELNKDNNVFQGKNQVNIVSQPADLVVKSAVIPTVGEAGKSIKVQWEVQNQGVGDTIATSWTDRIIASTDSVVGNNDVILDTFTRTGLLAPNGIYSRTETVNLPFSLEGNYQLFVTTDSRGNVYEGSNEGNNSSNPFPLNVTRKAPDLQVTAINLPVTGQSGAPITLGWTVKNSGTERTNSNSWYDKVYLSLDTTISGDDIELGSVLHSNVLDPAGSYTASGTFNLPNNATGNYYAIVRTDRDNSVIEGALENNNIAASNAPTNINPTTKIELTPSADLTVSSVDAPLQGVAGQPLSVTWTVANNGSNTENKTWYDTVYLSQDSVLDRSKDIYLGYRQQIGGLNAGTSYTATQSFDVPRGLGGNYYAFVVTDSNNQVYERNGESNNTNFDGFSTKLTLPSLTQAADLVVGKITIPGNSIPGQNATIGYTITNQGVNDAVGSWNDSLYISRDNKWDINDTFFGSVSNTGSVIAGGSYSQTVTATLPGAAVGDYYVIARSDIRNNLPEADETNNLGASLDNFTLDVKKLSLGTPDTGTLGKGQSIYYRIDVAEGETLRLNFDSQSPDAINELYVRYGDAPTRNQFDFGFTDAVAADQEVVIPTTKAGTYYVLAYGQEAPDAAPNFTVEAKLLDFEVGALSTKTGGNSGKVTVTISGAKFDRDTVITLVDKELGVEIATSRVDLVDSTKLYATFDLKGAKADDYDVVAKSGTNKVSTIQNGFTVVEGGKANLVTNIVAPGVVRAGTTSLITIQFANNGNVDLATPLASLVSNGLAPISLTRDDLLNQTSLDLVLQSDNSPFGVLAPGATGSISFYASATAPLDFSLSVIDDPNTALSWDSFIKPIQSQYRELFSSPDVAKNFWDVFRASFGETVEDVQSNLLKIQQLSLAVKRHEAEILGIPFSEKDYPTISLSDLYSISSFAAGYEANQAFVNTTIFDTSLALTKTLKIETTNELVLTPQIIIEECNTVLRDKKEEEKYDSDGFSIKSARFVDGTHVYFNVWKNGFKSFDNAVINPSNKTYIIIHGFDNTGGNPSNIYEPSSWMKTMANSLQQREPDSNVVLVDWENGASKLGVNNIPYGSAAGTTDFLGNAVGQYIVDKGYDVSKLTLIGHSLGAQTAGDAGEYLRTKGKTVGAIIGLDAAAPLFESEQRKSGNNYILDISDATKVIGIHTSLGDDGIFKTLATGFGFSAPYARQDLYIDPLRNESFKLVGYDHPLPIKREGLDIFLQIANHGYAYVLLNRLLAGEKIVDPNSGKILSWETLTDENAQSYSDKIPSTTGKVWDFQEKKRDGVILSSNAIEENSPGGAEIGKFSTKDTNPYDFNTYDYEYTFSNQNPENSSSPLENANGRFRIDGKRLVVAQNALLDYESAPTYSIGVKTTRKQHIPIDNSGGYTLGEASIYDESESFTIRLIDKDETDPSNPGNPNNPGNPGNPGNSGNSGDLIPQEPKPDQNFTIQIIRATDPNDIIGPAGFGDEKWTASQTLPYTIRFENIATATAPAQTVTITHPLDTDLDFRSFRLSSFGWGGLTFDVPPNRSFYNQRLDLTEKYGILVDVFAGIDTKKGEAFWTITTIDPKTGEPPEDPLAGFLPPNIANGIGDGFVNYTIRPKRDVQTGTVIDAEATIIFDTEAPINTPRIFNTIDVDKPITNVTNLPTASTTPEFLVSWEGTDKGSAIGNYTIYVSDNDGEFKPWLIDTTLTESTYTGVTGHTYKFSAIATDNAGNSQEISTLNTTPVTEATANIGDFVWLDSNADGIQNPGELGLGNVTVNLYNNAANLVTTTTTAANGSYSFGNISLSDYTVEVVAPTSYLFSDTRQGTDITLDSNVDPKTGKTDLFTANAGDNPTVDAGLYQLASITGQKWNDINGNGVKDTTETGLKDWKVYLDTNTNGQLDTGEISTTTDNDGNYSFTNLRPGTYTVAEQLQTGWKQTYPGVSVTTTSSDIQLLSPSSPITTSETFSTTSATSLVNLDKFWADSRFTNIKGKGFSTVIIDTGADVNHPLFGADADNNGIADKIFYQYDFADNDTDASDKNNHGSHIASIASAVAPESNLIILKVFKDSGTGSFSDLEEALQWVNSNTSAYNISSVNLSLGDGQNWNTPMSRYGIADELASIASQDILISAAAGNGFYTYNSQVGLAYPAIDPSVISVGAVWTDNFGSRTFSNGASDNTTAADRIASFSQRSPLLDVFAPGILITGANATGGTITMGGTSQATPYISAIATLAQEIAQTKLGRKLTLAEFSTLLATKSDLITDGDDENDNVTNTGAKYPRINVVSLAEGILSLSADGTTSTPTTPTNNGTTDSLEIPNNNNLNLVHTVTLTSGQTAKDLNFGNQKLNQLPILSNVSKTGNEDAKITFNSSDFTAAFSDADSNSLTKIKIASLPTNGTFQLNGIDVTLDLEIPVNELDKLVFTPNLNFSGDISFNWNGFDGTDYANIPASANLTINPLPRISIDNNTDADEATTPGKFILTRTGNTSQALTINYTLGGTATNSIDYQNLSGTITFKAGENKANIDLNSIDDNIYEGNETVILTLTDGGTNYKLDPVKSTNTLTITDNENRPTISLSEATPTTGTEGDANAKNRAFTISLSNPSSETITVDYGTIDGTAIAGSDFVRVAPTTLTFNPGETTKTVNINIIDDDIFEDAETFRVKLTNPTNATLAQKVESSLTIIDDDTPNISLFVTDVEAAEPPPEQPVNPGQFTFKRNGTNTNPLTIGYSLTGNTTNGTDYQKLGNTITFAAGSNTTTLDINPIDDKRYEGTETVTLTLLDGGTQYKLDPSNSGTVSIVENDPQTPKLTQPLPNILSIEGGGDKSTLKFTKIAQEGAGKNETFAFVVDDDKGLIGGIAPGSEGYLKAALDRSKVIFSNLGNNSVDRTFDLGSQRSLTFAPGDLVEFGSIVGDTIDKVKLDLISGKPTSEVLFSLPSANAGNGNQAQFTPLPNDGGYKIAWSNADTKTNPVYNDLVFKVESINNFTAPIGTNLQGNGEGEVLDLRSFAGQTLKIDTVAVSDAGYNNNIGFYAVADAQGTLANGLKVTDVGYAEAAIKSAILRSFKNETQLDRQVAGGEILAPVVIANGTFEDFLKTNPQNQANRNINAYFNYLGANTDKVDHFRLLGDNKFGVEDLYGGGDRDYNDVVFQLNVKV